MITAYFRPETLEEALKLLAQPETRPMGGGTWLNQPHEENFAVVDLQALGLNQIHAVGNSLEIDACVSLEQLLGTPDCPAALAQAIRQEASLNIRHAATVAGRLVTADGRSPFATLLLALDAKLTVAEAGSNSTVYSLTDYWTLRPQGLLTKIVIPLKVKTAYEQVARTPADLPIVAAGLAQWPGGRTRLALGGYGARPLLAMDGTEADGLESAAKNAFHEAHDPWASAEYRVDVAATLAKRCLEAVA